jgi:uncharacterized protein YdhG (YjbR/CyaY superfamily)
MAKTNFQSVDEYIASLPPRTHTTLRGVRATIRRALPKADEGISYQIPVYKIDGRMVLYFAGYPNHYSIYPATANMLRAMKRELAPLVHSKATIRFSYDDKIPAALLARIARFRAAEAGRRVVVAKKAKKAKQKAAKKVRTTRKGKAAKR